MATFWQGVSSRLRERLGQVGFETWISPLSFVGIEGHTATLQAPNKFFRNWVNDRYLNDLAAHQHDDLPDGASWRSGLSFDWPRQAIPPKRRGGVPAAEPGSRGEGLSKLDRSGLRAAFLREVFVKVFFF